jgi:SPX domain protein involved in polyphosphate accumulation
MTKPRTRYELKLVTHDINLPQVRSWIRLHSSCFNVAFPNRQINNLYFDTPHLDSYSDNLAGISLRKKLRLRWYGSDFKNLNSTLELKCKRSFQGWKVSQRIEQPFNLTDHNWDSLRDHLLCELKPQMRESFIRYSWPVLLNQYQREYYLSFDRKVRVTLDFAINAYDQRLSSQPNISRSIVPLGKMVIEIKADRENQAFLSEALACLPLRVGKHSKYALAMESILE